ncbi:MAG TPA: hypothetical protein VLA37_05420, partial [Sphingomonadaceae bacterium]|nr:hypothetical protein [Sphingomonadaceae bacterium]
MINRKLALSAAAGCLVFGAASSIAPVTEAAGPAPDRFARAIPASLDTLRLAEPVQLEGVTLADIDPALLIAKGRQEVIVRLRTPSVAKSAARTPADRTMHKEKLKLEQSAFLSRASRIAPGSQAKGSVQVVLNAVFMEVDAQQIRALANDPQVERIARVG